ncbi:hypothetical protein [Persephonella sp.]
MYTDDFKEALISRMFYGYTSNVEAFLDSLNAEVKGIAGDFADFVLQRMIEKGSYPLGINNLLAEFIRDRLEEATGETIRVEEGSGNLFEIPPEDVQKLERVLEEDNTLFARDAALIEAVLDEISKPKRGLSP